MLICAFLSPETLDATLIYQPNEMTKTEKTVLRVPATWLYPSGYSVSISPLGVAVWEVGCCDIRANSSIEISLTEGWGGEEIAVSISSN